MPPIEPPEWPTAPATAPLPPSALVGQVSNGEQGVSAPSLRDHLTIRSRRPQLIDLAMIVAAAGSYFHHINGAGVVAILVWWTTWALLWVLWGRLVGSLVGAGVSLVVLALMLVGPRTDLGFNMQRGCFDAKAQAALAAHDPEPRRDGDEQGDGRCGLMNFSVQTQLVRVRQAGTDSFQEDRSLTVWFRGAGERNWGPFDGNGMVFSPDGRPHCDRDVVGDTHGCDVELVSDGWYYYSYSSNIN